MTEHEMETSDKGTLRPQLSPTEERWAGSLGNESTIRNRLQDYKVREPFWRMMIAKYGINNCLEVGANEGFNLEYCMENFAYGIDINLSAIYGAQERHNQVIYGSALDIPFKDNFFDLVFTAGLLIHIPPKDIKKAMEEIIRVSNKYVLAIEYDARVERERPFLGEMGITWERPYNNLYTELGLRIVEAGFLTQAEGFNDLHWGMFKKC